MFVPAPLFGDRCVLPMDRELRIFGRADDGALIRAVLSAADGTLLTCGETVAADGRFLCLMPAVMASQTGCTLMLTCESETIRCEEVAVGLVFLAGGQSNMELALWNADEGQELISRHDDSDLRYFNVPKSSVWDEAAEAAEAASHWEAIRPNVGGDMSAVGYFFAAKLRRNQHVPVGIVGCNWGGTSVTAWMDEEALLRTAEGARYLTEYRAQVGDKTLEQWRVENDAFQHGMDVWNAKVAEVRAAQPGVEWEEIERQAGKCPWFPPVGWGSQYRPAGLAETMLKRITPAALSGFLYYQGEDDTGRTTCYDVLLCSMIVRWRELFMNDQLPFINMQLPMHIEKGQAENYQWPVLRAAQQKTADLMANTRLACIIDCGEFNNIHPTDKRTPGERMADEYLAMTGDAQAEARLCPRAVKKAALPGKVTVQVDRPIHAVNGAPSLFEIAEADGRFVPASARIVDGMQIELTAEGAARPVMARYAFVSYAKVNVFGENGAPLRPFVMK